MLAMKTSAGSSHRRRGQLAGNVLLSAAMAIAGASVGCSSDESGNPSSGGSGATSAGGHGATGGMGGTGAAAAGGTGGGVGAGGGPGGDALPGAKWIPSFVVKYGGASNLLSAEETANFDMIRQYRPHQNVVTRPVARGHGHEVIGHHEILLPLLRQAVIEELETPT